MRLEIGQIIKTNYDTGPYRIVSITRGCICSHILDVIEGVENPLPAHIHIWCKDLEGGKDAWLGYFDEETLKNVGSQSSDEIILCESDRPIQKTLVLN